MKWLGTQPRYNSAEPIENERAYWLSHVATGADVSTANNGT